MTADPIIQSALAMGVLRRLQKRLVPVILTVAVLVPAALGLHWWFWPSIPAVSADEVQSLEVHLLSFKNGPDVGSSQEEARVSNVDPERIGAILDVLQTAERASEHKCQSSGTITIRTRDGATEKLGILPGHDPAYYEYRYGSRINRVDRERLLAALKAIGVNQVLLSPP